MISKLRWKLWHRQLPDTWIDRTAGASLPGAPARCPLDDPRHQCPACGMSIERSLVALPICAKVVLCVVPARILTDQDASCVGSSAFKGLLTSEFAASLFTASFAGPIHRTSRSRRQSSTTRPWKGRRRIRPQPPQRWLNWPGSTTRSNCSHPAARRRSPAHRNRPWTSCSSIGRSRSDLL